MDSKSLRTSERTRRRSSSSQVKRREYQRLRNMVPSIAAKPNVSKVTVIEEAIRYIDHLHSALVDRLRTKGLPKCLKEVDLDVRKSDERQIREVVRHWIANSRDFIAATTSGPAETEPGQSEPNNSEQPSTNKSLERARTLPTYLQRIPKKKHH